MTRGDLDERADRQNTDDLAVVQRAHLGDKADIVDHLLCGIACCGINCGDEYIAVVVDIDLCAGIRADLLNGLAAGADNLANLIHGNLHGDHLRGEF